MRQGSKLESEVLYLSGRNYSWWKSGVVALTFGALVSGTVVSASAAPQAPNAVKKPIVKANKKLSSAQLAAHEKAMATRFIENKGQWDARAEFVAQTPNLNYWVTKTGVVYDYRSSVSHGKLGRTDGQVVQLSFEGANPSAISEGDAKLSTHTDFLRPKGASVLGVGSFKEAIQKGVYPGVDVRHYFDGARPRYDFVLKPGSTPEDLKLKFSGASKIAVSGKSELVIGTRLGNLRQTGLMAYQMVNGSKKFVDVSFRQTGPNTIGFALGKYDNSKVLVIDPLVYGSYFGGDNGHDEIEAVAAEPDGGVYMTGWTQAPSFPATNGPYGFNLFGERDAFICRFQGDAYNIDYNAYIGGSGNDEGHYIVVDPTGSSVWIAGLTDSTDLPGITGSSYQQTLNGGQNVFLMQFLKTGSPVLTPNYATYFGDGGETMKGFRIAPNGELMLAGETNSVLPNTLNSPLGGLDVYLVRMDSAGQNVLWSRYFGGIEDDEVNGLTIDADGNALISGSISLANQGGGQIDLSSPAGQSVFETTDGVYPNGRLLRDADAYAAKIDPLGVTLYSCVIGGSSYDFGAGIDVDPQGNAYVVATSGSFDYPRTRGVLGEGNLLDTIAVTKLSPDASAIIYSTGLNTGGDVSATGIAVDSRGYSYITGIVSAVAVFTSPPAMPPNPDVPIAHSFAGQIQVTPDAIKSAYTRANANAVDIIPTVDGWINVIDEAAKKLLYGSYIGSDLDDVIYPPYVDSFGDVWVFGSTNVFEHYVVVPRPPVSGNPPDPKIVNVYSPLPQSHITSLAWKPLPEPPFNTNQSSHDQDDGFREYGAQWGFPPFGDYFYPPFIDMSSRKDGYILRFRISLPAIQSVTLTPNVVAGGLGSTINGTVTLTGAAPPGGISVTLTLNNTTASSLVGSSDPANLVISIPAGGTTGTFFVATNPVSALTNILVKANYEGNFKVAQATIVPWLQQIALSPNQVVGGNSVTGRVTLSQVAPAAGVTVNLITGNSALVVLPTPASVFVPGGQQSATVTLSTVGVATSRTTNVTASFLNVGKTAGIRLSPASLLSLSFSPDTVAGGATSTATITLDGKAGSPGFDVTTTFVNPITGADIATPAGYSITPSGAISFAAGDSSKTFTIQTPYEAANVQRAIKVRRAQQGGYFVGSKTASLNVLNLNLVGLTLAPSTISGGTTSTGTVTISSAAPAGGVSIGLASSDTTVATLAAATVTVPAGATSANFVIQGAIVGSDSSTTISATYGPITLTNVLTVQGVSYTLSLNPTSVVGGQQNSVGTVVIGTVAPMGGISVNLSSSDTSVATVPASVTIAQGQTTGIFTVTSLSVNTQKTTTITAAIGSATKTSVLTVRSVGVKSVTISPSPIHTYQAGARGRITVTLDSPAPSGGVTIALSSSLPSAWTQFPTSVTVLAGQTSASTTTATDAIPIKFSRIVGVRIIAGLGSSSIFSYVALMP